MTNLYQYDSRNRLTNAVWQAGGAKGGTTEQRHRIIVGASRMMKIDERLIEQLMGRIGFSLSFVNYASGEFGFYRHCLDDPGLFERVYLQISGRKPNFIASASVGIACVRGRFSWRGLGERFCVLAAATNKDRGYSKIQTESDCQLWLSRFSDMAPTQISDAKKKFLLLLAKRTMHARTASQKYLQRLGFPCSTDAAKERISLLASEAQVVEANLALSDQIGWLANPVYHFVAVLAIRCLSSDVEPDMKYDFANPSEDAELMWRVQIIADTLMTFPKPMALIFPAEAGLGYTQREPLVVPRDIT